MALVVMIRGTSRQLFVYEAVVGDYIRRSIFNCGIIAKHFDIHGGDWANAKAGGADIPTVLIIDNINSKPVLRSTWT